MSRDIAELLPPLESFESTMIRLMGAPIFSVGLTKLAVMSAQVVSPLFAEMGMRPLITEMVPFTAKIIMPVIGGMAGIKLMRAIMGSQESTRSIMDRHAIDPSQHVLMLFAPLVVIKLAVYALYEKDTEFPLSLWHLCTTIMSMKVDQFT